MKKFGTILTLALGILIAGTAFGQSIDVTGTLSDFGSVMVTASSAEQSFTVGGTAIPTGQLITVTAPAGFKISLVSGSGYGTSIETPVEDGSGNIPAMTIYVIFSPTAVQAYSANITCTSASVPTQNVAAAGAGVGLTGNFSVGTANIGGEAGHYASLWAACQALTAYGVSGNVTMYLTSDLVEPQVVTLAVNATPYTVTFKPHSSLASCTITLGRTLAMPTSAVYGMWAIGSTDTVYQKLRPTSNVVVDGAISGTSRDLTILATGTGAAFYPIRVIGRCDNVTIKNCSIRTVGTGTYGIRATSVRTLSTDSVVTNLTIENNKIVDTAAAAGNPISIDGVTGMATWSNPTIKNNLLMARHRGIYFTYIGTSIISGNEIYVHQWAPGYASAAIAGLSTGSGTASIFQNKILELYTPYQPVTAYGIRGIQASGATAFYIYNNFITGFVSGGGLVELLGIRCGSTTYAYNNTIVLNDVTDPVTTYTYSGINVAAGTPDLRNNIIVTQEDGVINSCISGTPGTCDYNLYYRTGTTNARIQSTNADSTAWVTAAPTLNQHSRFTLPVTFVSATDLHLADSYKTTPDYNLAGTPIGTVTTDIDGQARSVTFPYMGADEILEQPLPVELTKFSASARGNNVELTWSTATETNNAGFSVERKAFGGDWQTVTFIKGQGTSNSTVNYSYSDKVAEGRYSYRLKQTDRNGAFTYSSIVEAVVEVAPQTFGLAQNYPNPFNPTTMVRFSVATAQKATLKIYNTAGQEVVTLFEGTAEAGRFYDVPFNASGLASGMYFSVLQTASSREVKKMTLLK